MTMKWTWMIYSSTLAWTAYWLSSLLLWYPWSYSPELGMTLMFVAATPIWIYAVYLCLKKYTGERLILGSLYTSLIFSAIAIVLDYFFYGVIRDAMTELYHPTTLYGYAFLMALPFIELPVFSKKFQIREDPVRSEFLLVGALGIVCLIAILFIIGFDIVLTNDTFQFLSMMMASFVVFNAVIGIVAGVQVFKRRTRLLILLSLLCVVMGMIMGKYGANWGLMWWIYYTVPLLMTLLLPPLLLQMNRHQTLIYWLLSFMSAPFLHFIFSFFFNWPQYMPFLEIPYFRTLL